MHREDGLDGSKDDANIGLKTPIGTGGLLLQQAAPKGLGLELREPAASLEPT